MPNIMWFRRDLRITDNPALGSAISQASATADGELVPIFIIDPVLWQSASPRRRSYLAQSLRMLNESLANTLVVLAGSPVEIIPELAARLSAKRVDISADFGPYGARRDQAVQRSIAAIGCELAPTGSPYAVSPGRIRKPDGTPYRVYTPYFKQWLTHGWPRPAPAPSTITALTSAGLRSGLTELTTAVGSLEFKVGEPAAHERWADFTANGLHEYGQQRDRPDLPGTSRLSAALKFGEIHPRTMLATMHAATELSQGAFAFMRQIAFRDFYADVVGNSPRLTYDSLVEQWNMLALDRGPEAEAKFRAWREGRTGFPLVDAGMRQLSESGWLHNRLRMIVASFLTKDLHQDWRAGARWFMSQLFDADIANNSQGWQWVAGAGTDAAPYHRVFNPVTQGKRFDPDGNYVRRWVPELAHLPGAAIHEPWLHEDGYLHGYPRRIVDHAAERVEALARWSSARR